jgi:alpha-maltose-1-phosphate synthase
MMHDYLPKVSIFHPGTQYAMRIAEQLHSHGLLKEFWTGIGFSSADLRIRLLSGFFRKYARALENRISNSIPPSKLKRCMLPELASLIARSKSGSKSESYFLRNERFQRAIPTAAIQSTDIVVGYDTSSWILAERAKKFGRLVVLDQSIGHPCSKERIFDSLRSRYPDWSTVLVPKPENEIAAERREHELADKIMAPSSFVAATLVENGVDKEKIVVNPFGTDTSVFYPPNEFRCCDQELHFLFVGGISPRKGIPDLIEAWQLANLENARLTIVGGGVVPSKCKDKCPKTISWVGKKSRQDVASLMRRCNALIFPSHFEGLAQVQVEALACALPVIGTFESGATDIVHHNITGAIIPRGEPDKLSNLLRELHSDREILIRWERSIRDSMQDFSWNAYVDRWINLVTPIDNRLTVFS